MDGTLNGFFDLLIAKHLKVQIVEFQGRLTIWIHNQAGKFIILYYPEHFGDLAAVAKQIEEVLG